MVLFSVSLSPLYPLFDGGIEKIQMRPESAAHQELCWSDTRRSLWGYPVFEQEPRKSHFELVTEVNL